MLSPLSNLNQIKLNNVNNMLTEMCKCSITYHMKHWFVCGPNATIWYDVPTTYRNGGGPFICGRTRGNRKMEGQKRPQSCSFARAKGSRLLGPALAAGTVHQQAMSLSAALILGYLALLLNASAQSRSGWTLVWSDEFNQADGTSP